MVTMSDVRPRRRQCSKCPWRKDVDPYQIPNGYSLDAHRALRSTIADSSATDILGPIHVFACHETPKGDEMPCVGWLRHQLGPGNNIGLRLRVSRGVVDAHVETIGEQHATFEDTIPVPRTK